MQRLWSPWRLQYVTGGDTEPGTGRGDIFLDALERADDDDSLVLHVGRDSFLVMNLYPYNSGHMMAVPKRRVPSIEDLDPHERAELFELVNLAMRTARLVLRCDGFNVGMNVGAIAGAGVSEHVHIHIVPRWLGDANFMPIIGNTMVMPELLLTTTARLRGEIATIVARKNGHTELDAGCVTVLPDQGLVVLRRAKDGTIVLPKGHIESGESAAEAAAREVMEETGFRARIVGWGGVDSFEFEGQQVHAVYFVAEGERTRDVDDHLDVDTILVPASEAPSTVDFPALKPVVERALRLTGLALDKDSSDSP